ncbi:protein yippee-like isoform X1 [Cucumis sativus]|uniref:protein yippee-like isoform X1 n=1 Tax=Cucumis sativus TaxID=3659 RepID=UPI0012F52995|nr:protein yippee-like isoform X1 [Cucumis sativus]
MGRLFVVNLEGQIYSCKFCRTHLALYDDIISKELGNKRRYDKFFDWENFMLLSCPNILKSCLNPHCNSLYCLCCSIQSFHSRHGKAYLFNKVVNVCLGKIEERLMMTGMHTVADIFCVGCGSMVGWKYETAHEKNQKYKEGKSVLERFKVLGPDESSHWVSHEADTGGSEGDDV